MTPITIQESPNPGYFQVNGLDYAKYQYSLKYDNISGGEAVRNFSLCSVSDGSKIIASRGYAEIKNGEDVALTSWSELLDLFQLVGALASNDVSIQDQSTPLIIASMSKEEAATTLAIEGSIDDLILNVTDATGFTVGGYLSVFSVPDNRFYLASIVDIVVNAVEVDTPLDFAYPAGSFVTSGTRNMNVDGSTVPVIFGLRNTEEAVGSSFDITRIIISCLATSTIDLSMFGNIAGGITRGIVFRKVDGVFRNVFNAKTNAALKNLMYDFDIQAAQGAQQDGFNGRLTFAGQNKMGVVIRIKPGEDVQMIIQDNLLTLQGLSVICEGHIVE